MYLTIFAVRNLRFLDSLFAVIALVDPYVTKNRLLRQKEPAFILSLRETHMWVLRALMFCFYENRKV